MTVVVHVMVGILRDRDGRILINQRPAGKPQAGRWEYPGGKLEPGESPQAGLRRELREELGIVAGPMQRLIEVHHEYAHVSVRLDVREIGCFGGMPQSREGQLLKWVPPDLLPSMDILEADHPVTQALRLPDRLLVTPDAAWASRSDFLHCLERALAMGTSLVQLRSKSLSDMEYARLADDVLVLCRRYNTTLILNASPGMLSSIPADGIHLDSTRLRRARSRPLDNTKWVSAACHTATDLRHAEHIGVDFALVSPVSATATHPGAQPIGWAGLRALVAQSSLPIYALGGMKTVDIAMARACGARGIAAIRALWSG